MHKTDLIFKNESHFNKLKKENLIIVVIVSEKALDKIPNLFMIESLSY